MTTIQPMQIHVPPDVLDDLRGRLARTRWLEAMPEGGWSRDVDLAYPREPAPIVRQRADRSYNVTRFAPFAKGGHFAVHKRVEEMAEEMRAFFRPLRNPA